MDLAASSISATRGGGRPRRRQPGHRAGGGGRGLPAGHHRAADRRGQHTRPAADRRRPGGRRPAAAGVHDRLRHDRARPDCVNPGPVGGRGAGRRLRFRRWRRLPPLPAARRARAAGRRRPDRRLLLPGRERRQNAVGVPRPSEPDLAAEGGRRADHGHFSRRRGVCPPGTRIVAWVESAAIVWKIPPMFNCMPMFAGRSVPAICVASPDLRQGPGQFSQAWVEIG